ncbi:hypothetical protein DFH28DRAFT_1153550 [Melampsora americana]|nr:hypothetical protein DFH28DRAFT_1153550 [Melampsora americana]
MISCDSNLLISSSPHHGVIVFDQLNQLHHKLNIKSKSKIVSISVSGFSSKLFTINLESKILLFDLNLHSTKPITAFKFNQSNQSTHPSHQTQPSLINAHFSNINSNLIVFLNRLGQIGLADLTHHRVISQTQLRLSKNTSIKLSNFSPNGKTLICLTNDGQLISKDLKSSKQITLLKLSSIETRSTLQLLFQSNLTVDHHHTTVHSNQPIPRSHSNSQSQSNSNSISQSHRTKQDLNENQTPTEILMTSSQPIELDRDSLHPSSSSSSISTLISPKLKPISTQPRSKKEFESGLKSEARVSTLVSKIDETLKDEDDDDPAERLVTVSVRQLRSIIEGCVNRSIEAHQRIMMEKFEELRLDVMRQGFSTRKEIDERFDQFGFRSNPP